MRSLCLSVLSVLLIFFLLDVALSASLRKKHGVFGEEDIISKKECKKKMSKREFEWYPTCYGKTQHGKMEHYEVNIKGKCVRLEEKVKRKCRKHNGCSEKVFQEFCKANKNKARRVTRIKYKKSKVTGKCIVDKKVFIAEACARFIPWIPCPKHKRMEVGECQKDNVRKILVRRYERMNDKTAECKKKKIVTTYEKCDYKKLQKKRADRKAKKAAKKAAKKGGKKGGKKAKTAKKSGKK